MWSAGSKNDLPLFWGRKNEKPHISARELPKFHYLEERFTSIKDAVARPPEIELKTFAIV